MVGVKRKLFILSISVVCALAVMAVVSVMQKTGGTAAAEALPTASDEFIVTDTADEILAEYSFARLNDTDCSVKISNKSVATKAVIPSAAEIDGVKYRVTEIAANGFMSATKLKRVSLPATVEKIGNMAFYNCTSLSRISLANAVTIGNNVFYGCKGLSNLVLPRSVKTVGSNILRNCTTTVRVRADAAGADWSASWNTGNNAGDAEFGSTYVEPLELETVYGASARSAGLALEGYVVADGQPRTETYYIESDEQKNIYIPGMFNNEYILGISNAAFDGASFDQLIVEYSARKLMVGPLAFVGAMCNSITINRDVEFVDPLTGDASDNVFAGSAVETVVLPDTITEFTTSMFAGCAQLKNIFYHTPVYMERREDMLKIVDDCAVGSDEGVVYVTTSEAFDTIGESAFDGAVSIERLHIYDNVKDVRQFAFGGWTVEQTIYVHNEDVNFTAENGFHWHADWLSGCDASVYYAAKYYKIAFDPNGGSVSTTTKDAKANAAVGELPLPEYAHHVFDGWFDADGNEYDADTLYTVEDDITLYAHWHNYKYYAEYDANRPNEASSPVIGVMNASEHEYGVSSILSANAYIIVGWHFVGWSTDRLGGDILADGQAVDTLNEENGGTTVLYAQWARNSYTVEYVANRPIEATGGYCVEGSMADTRHEYDSLSPLRINAYTLSGWRFIGWNTKADGSGTPYADGQQVDRLSPFDGNIAVLYAQWQLINYKILLYPEGRNGESVLYGTYTVETFEITFETVEENGYRTDWSPRSIPRYSTGDKLIVGDKRPVQFMITYLLNDGNYDYMMENWYTVENHVIFKEAVKENHLFGGWLCNGEPIIGTEGLMEDITVEAVWIVDPVGYDVYTGTTAKTVTEKYSTVNLPNSPFASSCHITIAPSVKWFAMKSNENITYKMYITVSERTDDLEMHLENFTMKAPDGYTAITASSHCTLDLYSYECKIYGSGSAVKGRGLSAVSCYDLTIRSPISIYGGNGATGAKGADGESCGAPGGRGGNGFKGGCALVVRNALTVLSSDVYIKGGDGGNGGNGGNVTVTSSGLAKPGAGGFGGPGAAAASYGSLIYGEDVTNVVFERGRDGSKGNEGFIRVYTYDG